MSLGQARPRPNSKLMGQTGPSQNLKIHNLKKNTFSLVFQFKKFGPWATIWANGTLQFSNLKTGPGLGQNNSAQAHGGPNPKNGFQKARAWPELIPIPK